MNARLCFGLAAFVLLCLVQSSTQKGVLYADTIYSSSEETITIDRLNGDKATVTDATSDILSFGAHNELNIDAPGISATGSFFSARGSDSINFQSSANNVNINSGDNLETNAQNVNIVTTLGDLILDARRGKINFKSGDHIDASSSTGDLSISSNPGGIRAQSEGGHIIFDAGDDLAFSGSGKAQILSQETASFAAADSLTLNANSAVGTIDFDAPAQLSIIGSTGVSFSSTNSGVTFNIAGPLDFHADRDFTARSTGNSMNLVSSTDGITMLSGLGFTASSGGAMNIKGAADGVLLQSTGDAANAKVTIDAPNGKIDFTGRGDGDLNGIHIKSGSVVMNAATDVLTDGSIIRVHATETLSASATNALRVLAGSELDLESGTVSFQAGTTATTSSQSDDLFITAFDRSSANNGNGLVSLDATQNVNFRASTSTLVDGGDITVTSNVADIAFTASRITLSSDRAHGDEQLFKPIVGRDWKVTTNTGNVIISGGVIDYTSTLANTFTSAQSVLFSSVSAPGDRTVFASKGAISVNAGASSSFVSTGETSLFAGGDSTVTAQTSLTFTTQSADFARLFTFHSNVDTSIGANTVDITSSGIQRWSARNDASLTTTKGDITVDANTINLLWNSATGIATTITSQSNNFGTFQIAQSTDGKDLFQILGDDSVSFTSSSGTYRVTTGDLLSVLSGGQFLVKGSAVNWQTDERSNFTITSTGPAAFDANQDITVRGNSLDFVGADVNAVANTINLTGRRRGLWSRSDANLTFKSKLITDSVSISSQGGNNAFLAKEALTATSTSTITFTSGGGARLFAGSQINLKSALDTSILSSQNISATAGSEKEDDFLTITSVLTNTFTASDSIAVAAAQGVLSFVAAKSFTASSSAVASQILSEEDVSIVTGSYSQSANDLVLQGGNVVLDASTSFKLDATGNFQLRSEPSSFGYNNTKNIDSTILIEGKAKLFTTASNLLSIKGQNKTVLAANNGTFTSIASNILIQTVPSDMDSDFSSGGAVEFIATSTQFPIAFDSSNDLLLAAQTGNLNITGGAQVTTTSGGSTVFNATGCIRNAAVFQDFIAQGGSFNEKSDYALTAGTFASYTTLNGLIDISSLGFSYLRSDKDGRSPTEGADFFETVGFTIRSTEKDDGNILVQALKSNIIIQGAPVLIRSPAYVNITGQNGVNIESTDGPIAFVSTDGGIDAVGATGVDFTTGEASISASTKFQMRTKSIQDYVALSGLNIQAEEGSIYGFTNNKNNIDFFSSLDLKVSAGGSGADFKAQGKITQNSDILIIKGFSGTNLKTNNGPISFNAVEEGINLSSDLDFTLTSGGSQLWTTVNDITINAGVNGYFSTDAGSIDATTTAFTLGNGGAGVDGGDLTIRSLGTSQSGRDHVLFRAVSGSLIFSTEGNVAIDAIEEVLIGETTLPVVSFSSGGSDNVAGFTLSSGTNIEFSDIKGTMDTTAVKDITFISTNSHTIDTFGAVSFTTTGTDGFRALSRAPAKIDAAVGGITLDSELQVKLSSDEFFKLDANGGVLGTDDVTFNSDIQIIAGARDILLQTAITYDVDVSTAFPGQPNIALNGDARATLSTTDSFGGSIFFNALGAIDGDMIFTSTAPQYWNTLDNGAGISFIPTISAAFEINARTNSSQVSLYAGNTLATTSVSGNIQLTPSNNAIIRSGEFSFKAARDVIVAGDEDVYTRAFSAAYKSTAGDLIISSAGGNVTFDSTSSHSVDSTTTLDVISVDTKFVAGLFSLTKVGGKLTIDGTDGTEFNVFSPSQAQGSFTITSPDNFNVLSNDDDIEFYISGPHSNLIFSTGTDFTANVVDANFYSGDDGRSIGQTEVTTDGKLSFTSKDFSVSNIAFGVSPGSPDTLTQDSLVDNFVKFSAAGAITTQSSVTNFNANGNNVGSGFIRAIANDTINFSSVDLTTTASAGSILHFADGILYQSTNYFVHTEGAGSEILFRSRSELLDIDAVSTVTISSNNDIAFTTPRQIVLDSPQQTFTTTIDGNENNRGIVLFAPTISLPATTTTFTTSSALSDIFITGGAVTLQFNAFTYNFGANPSSLSITGRGGSDSSAYAGAYPEQRFGVDLRADDDVTFSSPSQTFSGGEAIIFDATLATPGTANSLSFSASSIMNIHSQSRVSLQAPGAAVMTLTAGSFRFEADNAIEFASTDTTVATASFDATTSLTVTSGLEQAEASRIGFYASGDVSFTAGTGNNYQLSEDNIKARALDDLTIQGGSVLMLSDFGSQLYYATETIPGTDENFIISAVSDIEFEVYGEFRHRQSTFVGFFVVNPGTNPTNEVLDGNDWENVLDPHDWSNGPAVPNAPCQFSSNGQADLIFDCPQAASRAYQIAQALENYGLFRIIP
eukprot:TRINITY_DN227_c0_g1_i1.p1 TRINITY_DN227_c0_g1~~TRINITY_DN227_c0_g1_i1.p1  ORF type:complete len:2434 (-),score=1329.25 TRINITY_DN227_c0_g1_i1:81-7166(-)